MLTDFGCNRFYTTDSVVNDSMSTLFGFSTDSACCIIVFDCPTGFDNLKAAFGCPKMTDFISTLFDFSAVFDSLRFFKFISLKINDNVP